jgi:predicted metal-dependent hydrolase
MDKLRKDLTDKSFITGESLYYLGKAYGIVSLDVENKGVYAGFNGENFLVYINESIKNCERKDTVRTALVKWYRERARYVFEERTSFYSRMLKLYPGTIRIKEQKTMWGSCSGRGNINYNWRLIMAPIDILDYVVVHELCHLKHKNHSKEFWNLVESIFPDYSQNRKWLRENGMKLCL